MEAVVLSIDAERERISLGVKQMEQDPFASYMGRHPKGSIVVGTIREVDPRGAVIDLEEGIDGYLRVADIARERIEDARTALNAGDSIEARIVGMDRKTRSISLSIKAKEMKEEADAVAEYSRSAQTGTTSLGDLLKEQMGDGNKVA